MAPVPRRTTLLRSMTYMEDRLRASLVTQAGRQPVETEPPHVIGAVGEPGFENGWSAAAGFGPPRFWKTSDGWVNLAGVATSTTGTGAFLTPMFTLPAGYRPPFEQGFTRIPCAFEKAPFTSMIDPLVAVLWITAENRTNEGQVFPAGPAIGTDAYSVSLDGVFFRTI